MNEFFGTVAVAGIVFGTVLFFAILQIIRRLETAEAQITRLRTDLYCLDNAFAAKLHGEVTAIEMGGARAERIEEDVDGMNRLIR